jgi:hypothetical protein
MFTKNCDHFFTNEHEFIGRSGTIAPLNTGFFAVKPSLQSLNDMVDVLESRDFDPDNGWLGFGPIRDWRTASKLTDWRFYCASTDQGIFYYYFMCYKKTGVIEHNRAWEDHIVHFSGSHKVHLAQNISTIPEKYRAATVEWLVMLAAVHQKYKTRLDHDKDVIFQMTNSTSYKQRSILIILG